MTTLKDTYTQFDLVVARTLFNIFQKFSFFSTTTV